MSGRALLPRLLRPRLRVRQARLTPLSARARLFSTLPDTPIFRALQDHDRDNLAVVHSASSRSFTYGNLIADVLRAKEDLEQKAAKSTGKLAGERIAFLAENSYDYVGMWHFYSAIALRGLGLIGISDSSGHLCQRCHCAASVAIFSDGRIAVYTG